MVESDIPQSIEEYLEEDETSTAHVSEGDWNWICTSDRIIKYLSSKNDFRIALEISLEGVTGIERTETGRPHILLLPCIILSPIGFIILLGTLAEIQTLSLGHWFAILLPWILMFIIFSIYLKSGNTYYQFNGVEAYGERRVEWRIDITKANRPELNEFVQAVRKNIS